MRIAIVSFNAQAGNAIGNNVAAKAAFFLERGADVRIFLESDRDLHPDLDGRCEVLRPSRVPEDTWRFLREADLLLVEYGHHYSLLDLLPLLSSARPRILIDYHGVTPPELWGKHNRELLVKGVEQRGLLWCADAVLVHSRFTRTELLRDCGLPAERLHSLGYILDTTQWRPDRGPCRLRQRLGLKDATVLLYVGRLAPNKNVPILVEALARLSELRGPVHILLAGDDDDLYAAQAERCRQRAAELGAADRLHFLGRLTGDALIEAYHAADVLVTASRWESFCIPIIEAQAVGLPVVAARCTALPETVGDAGLTFALDDVDDLVRQVQRVLSAPAARQPSTGRIALVTPCYGPCDGVSRSLQLIGATLQEAGYQVEVFTTCARSQGEWRDRLPAGTERGTLTVYRFPVDPLDEDAHRAALVQAAPTYPAQAPRSAALVRGLRDCAGAFDVVIAGPYLSGVTLDVARALPEKTLLLPCFHDELMARLPGWHEVYRETAGVLYHSVEEQEFAQAELGVNHPNAHVIGTYLPAASFRSEPEAQARVPDSSLACASGSGHIPVEGRFLVYAGRCLREKGVPTLLEYFRRYTLERPGRFTLVVLGQGDVAIPQEPWVRNLGLVSEEVKRDVLVAADALVQLSRHESLSLVALESWAQGTPVIADEACAVLAGHLRRSGGGVAIADYERFAQALDDLWDNRAAWQARGERGRAYVASAYGSRPAFRAQLEAALAGRLLSLREQLQRRGPRRSAQFSSERWREHLATVVEKLLDAEPRQRPWRVEVRRRAAIRRVSRDAGTVLLPVRVINWGEQLAAAEGPGRTVLRHRLVDADGRDLSVPTEPTTLSRSLMPGRSAAAVVPVAVPDRCGSFDVIFWADRLETAVPAEPLTTTQRLVVVESAEEAGGCCAPLLEMVQQYLTEATRLQRLPEDYEDVTLGPLAPLKRRFKRKLLGNFKHAYVDVLSRQQSALNCQLLSALHELSECCATLDHAVRVLQKRLARSERRAAKLRRRTQKPQASRHGGPT